MLRAVSFSSSSRQRRRLAHSVAPLPFEADSLQRLVSARSFRRQRAYQAKLVDKLNLILHDSEFQHRPLDEVVTSTASDPQLAECFNHASEIWNLELYWSRLTPGGIAPPSELLRWIERDFESYDRLVEQITAHARGIWGSGWTWLILDRRSLRLRVCNTFAGASSHPLALGLKPLLALDMWEHAYWYRYRGDREAYVRAYLDLVNWQAVSSELIATANKVDEHAKLKYVIRIAMDDMQSLQMSTVQHGTVDLNELPSLARLQLMDERRDDLSSTLVGAIREVSSELEALPSVRKTSTAALHSIAQELRGVKSR